MCEGHLAQLQEQMQRGSVVVVVYILVMSVILHSFLCQTPCCGALWVLWFQCKSTGTPVPQEPVCHWGWRLEQVGTVFGCRKFLCEYLIPK